MLMEGIKIIPKKKKTKSEKVATNDIRTLKYEKQRLVDYRKRYYNIQKYSSKAAQ